MFNELAADAVDIRDLGFWADPDAVVDHAADVFGEVAVDGRLDRADRLVQEDVDGVFGFRRRPSAHHAGKARDTCGARSGKGKPRKRCRGDRLHRSASRCLLTISPWDFFYGWCTAAWFRNSRPRQYHLLLLFSMQTKGGRSFENVEGAFELGGDCGVGLLAVFCSAVVSSIGAGFACAGAQERAANALIADVVLRGGTVIDGTGAPARRADLAIVGERIFAGETFEIGPDTKLIDVSSLVVAPGFIDLHTHSDPAIAEPARRLNLNYLRQGVTTIVTGNCGLGLLDAGKFLATIDAHGAGTNVIHLVPHGSLRASIMGKADRPPSADELTRMKQVRAAGDAERSMGAFERIDLCARPLRQDTRADRARQGGRGEGRDLCLAHPK